MNRQPLIDEQTLLDYFSGSLSAARRQEVEEWIEASDEHRKIARDVEYICVAADTLHTIQSVDTARALADVKRRIRSAKGRRSSLWQWVQRIAAVLVLPLLASTLYFATRQEEPGMVEVRTNPGMIASFDLPDGSHVWLNSHSTLKYPKAFTGKSRSIELDGEAYFSVHKDKSKRFVVSTPCHLRAEVLGTEFNIEAYKENNKVVTTLVSGSVCLSFAGKNEKEEHIYMKPNDEIAYDTDSKNIKLNQPYLPTMTAWKDGLVVFRNTPFEKALNILGKRFNVEFVVKNDLLYDNSFTGSFDGQHLNLILEHFRLSTGIQYAFVDPQPNADRISPKTVVELY